jgi:predicted DCC family thiol-disulfide oxidoreductase YuxK
MISNQNLARTAKVLCLVTLFIQFLTLESWNRFTAKTVNKFKIKKFQSSFILQSMTLDSSPIKRFDKNSNNNAEVNVAFNYDNYENTDEDKIDLLFDSECPICAMEVEFLKKRDLHNKIRFTDLSSPSYNPIEHGNVEFAEGMRKIRAVLPDKTVITGVEVFRQTYKAIGLGWIFDITNIPYIGKAADFLYDVWAENRLRITGRGDLADVLKEKAEILRNSEPVECDEDGCALDFD